MQENQSNILIYQTTDGVTKIETRLLDDTVWLTQVQICELFQKSKSTISAVRFCAPHKGLLSVSTFILLFY
jgi:hypothetical protein